MRHLLAAVCFVLAAAPALAQDTAKDSGKKAAVATEKSAKKEPTAKQKAQHDRMRSCSKEAKDKSMKGDERKKFMSECLGAAK